MFDRLLSAFVALSLALLIWLYARSRDQEMLDNVPVPVQITVAASQAEHYSLEIAGPSQVPVSFSGPPSRMRELRSLLQHGELRVEASVTVPDEHQNESHYRETVRIDAADIHVPPGVTPVLVEGRNRIPVTLYRLVEKSLLVRFDPSPEERIHQVTLEPTSVLVRGPQEVLDRTRYITTQPCVLPAHSENATQPETLDVGPVPLMQEINGRTVRTIPGSVMVQVTLKPKRKLYEVEAPVHFLCPSNCPCRPRFRDNGREGKITLSIWGPAAEDPPEVFVFVDLTAANKFHGLPKTKLQVEPLRLQLPPGYQLAQPLPRSVAFELLPWSQSRTR